MAAPLYNRNAETVTLDFVLEKLQLCIDSLKTLPYHTSLSRAYMEADIERGDIFYWKTKFKDNPIVLDTIKRVKDLGERTNEIRTEDAEQPVAWGAFSAKCNFGWVEKGVELEINRDVPLVKVVSVKADGTRVER